MRSLWAFFGITFYMFCAVAVPKNTKPRVEDDPTLEISQPLDLQAEIEGYRSRADLKMDDAEVRFYQENAGVVDQSLISEIEEPVLSAGSSIDLENASSELANELADL